MSDLISRSELIEEIDKLLKSPYANQQQFGFERKETIKIVRDVCVRKQPIAYSVDDVVKGLESRICTIDEDDVEIAMRNKHFRTAIEIVKQGYISKETANIKYDYVDYELKSGDSIYTIGKKHGQQIDLTGPWIDRFKEVNHFVDEKTFDKFFKAGNIVKVPIWREKDE